MDEWFIVFFCLMVYRVIRMYKIDDLLSEVNGDLYQQIGQYIDGEFSKHNVSFFHSKEINACFRNHLISSSFQLAYLIAFSFFAHRITHKRELDMKPEKVPKIFAEILYNSNSNSLYK